MADIAPFHVMKLLARARAMEASGRSIIHMEIGEPDFETPQPVIQAGIEALQKGRTHYTPALGLPALRQAIADYYQVNYRCKLADNNIVITPGSSGALQLICGVLINPGDEVLLTDPGYPCNRHFVQLMGGRPRFFQLSETNNYQFNLDELKKNWTPKTRMLMLASPANPTGVVLDESLLVEIARFARKRNAYLLVDEIYHGLIYDTHVPTMAACLDNVFVINSFSKYFCMTGWRIGWLVSPEKFVEDIDKLAQNIFLAASTPGQYAALAAFTE
ncbi:MAG TPA: aminotransferase class I/II-fold pyridoxal phosphate-dependent enzyme, partial [Gammaproteobacteria bacterium]|nr:aminotransferase class I/II-fold pyridoxal phosphate-dependent enzyme [Gammaproteobacteria bacterium]